MAQSVVKAPILLMGLAAVAAMIWHNRREPTEESPRYPGERELRPPFPTEIVQLLDAASLCYLSTTMNNAPHLSLMNYTYDRETETIIFSTRRNTRKCDNLIQNPSVAILLHDFPHLKASDKATEAFGKTFAITLYGTARVLPDGVEATRLRAKHLAHNPKSSVFITGDGIAMVAIDVEYARVCDAQDKVSNWSVADGWDASSR